MTSTLISRNLTQNDESATHTYEADQVELYLELRQGYDSEIDNQASSKYVTENGASTSFHWLN